MEGTNVVSKKVQAVRKVGSKFAQDALGVSETGGMMYYTFDIPVCEGNLDLLRVAMNAANESKENGGAPELAKCMVSINDQSVCIMLYVPEALESVLSLKDWSEATIAGLNARTVYVTSDAVAFVAQKDPSENLFPLKMKDQAMSQSLQMLRSKKLVVDDEDDYDIGEMYAKNDIEW